jgi:putative transcriptional regulator
MPPTRYLVKTTRFVGAHRSGRPANFGIEGRQDRPPRHAWRVCRAYRGKGAIAPAAVSPSSAGGRDGRLAPAINSIEKERYTPSLPLAIALARFFGKTVEEVFHADGNP